MAKYTEEMVDTIENMLEGAEEASLELVKEIAEALDVAEKSVAAKLRSMGITTEKKNKGAAFTDAETETFIDLVQKGLNAAEIADQMGKTPRQVYGKALSLKMHVAAPEKEEYVRKYTEEEEAKIEAMVADNAFIEDIAEALGKTVPQIRGKLLSMKLKAEQRDKKETVRTVIYTDEVVDNVIKMVEKGETSEAIAEALELNLRGVRSRIGKLLKEGKIEALPSDMGKTAAKTLVDYTDEVIAQMKALAEDGLTSAEAAEELDIPVASLRSKAGRLGIKFAKPVKSKETD